MRKPLSVWKKTKGSRPTEVVIRPPRRTLASALLAVLLSGAALACGPDFPPDLLSDRTATLLEFPEPMFMHEATQLLPAPTDGLVVTPRVEDWSLPEEQRFDPETDGIAADLKPLVAQMRATSSVAEAELVGAALPAEVRTYTAGAVAFHLGDFETAQARFEAVLALPEGERRLRSTWAAFMLGRLALRAGDLATAQAQFQRTRELRTAGFADPHELAIATWGHESAYHLAQNNVVAAIAGYAQEAARGSDSGRASLLIVARRLFREPDLLAASIQDPTVQKLAAAYAFTRSGEVVQWRAEQAAANQSEATDGADAESTWSEPPERPSGSPSHDPAAVDQLVAAIDSAALPTFAGADRLAAAAYSAGRYAQAERFAPMSASPLALWVQAKMKLRGGDADGAAALLAKASAAFPSQETWADPGDAYVSWPTSPQCRVQGEEAILRLGRGEFVAAAKTLFQAGDRYWTDLAYVAERVLTLDELVALTRELAPSYVPPPQTNGENYESWPLMADQNVGNLLRWLTARRLLRQQRHEEALGYFDVPALKDKATQYVAALKSGASGDPLDRARALTVASDLARRDGLELIGFEGDPDYQLYGGMYDHNDPTTWDADYNPIHNPRTDLIPPPDFSHADEKSRLEQSRAQPLERFHYRYTAAQLAVHAAEQVPARSQAFAALLCRATAYVVHRNPDAATRIYKRYLDEGAFVPWGAVFGTGDSYGSACPAPDFDRVAAQQQAARMAKLKRIAKYVAIPAALLIAGVVGFLVWRRRRKPA